MTKKTTVLPKSTESSKVRILDCKKAPRYAGVYIDNITVGTSPFWLQKALLLSGMRPINTIVDVTNYILIKRGQPLHAFDRKKIANEEILVTTVQQPQEWVGLDGVPRNLAPGMLTICDAEKVLAVAGVLGGENSAVQENTTSIFLEAAHFDSKEVRKSSKMIGVRTESAMRFEKGVDPEGVWEALQEATALILELCPQAKIIEAVDCYPNPYKTPQIHVRKERVNRFLGTELSLSEMEDILKRLHFHIESELKVTPPSYRFDVNEEVDCIEEIARIYGYNNIPRKTPHSTNAIIPHSPAYLFETKVRALCVGQGLQEFLTADLISPKMAELCKEIAHAKGIHLLKTLHAKTEEYSILRPSLLPGMLSVARTNMDFKNNNFQGFEIGRIHFVYKGKSVEIPMLSLLLSGEQMPLQWGVKKQEADFYTIKGIIENLCLSLHLPVSFRSSSHCSFHPGRQAEVCVEDLVVGTFGELHPQVLLDANCKQRILFAELNLEELMRFSEKKILFQAIPQFPASDRDWTITLSKSTPMDQIFQAIHAHKPKILEKYLLLDLYEKEEGNNVTLRFIYRDPSKTLSNEEVEKEHLSLTAKIQASLSSLK